MGRPVDFAGTNMTLGPPKGMTEDQVQTVKAYHGNGQFVLCWKMSPEELDEINATGMVWLSLMGTGLQPSFVGSESEVLKLLFNTP